MYLLWKYYISCRYSNTGNISAHYHETAVEILEQMSEFDSYIVVMGAGTGGTLTGVSLRLKSANPEIYIVGVDPEGSILHKQKWEKADIRKAYEVEGIGYDFHPSVFRSETADRW